MFLKRPPTTFNLSSLKQKFAWGNGHVFWPLCQSPHLFFFKFGGHQFFNCGPKGLIKSGNQVPLTLVLHWKLNAKTFVYSGDKIPYFKSLRERAIRKIHGHVPRGVDNAWVLTGCVLASRNCERALTGLIAVWPSHQSSRRSLKDIKMLFNIMKVFWGNKTIPVIQIFIKIK